MKKIAFTLLPFLLMGCAPKKGVAAFIKGKHRIESTCPEEGECKFELLKDTSLAVHTDDTGKLYYSLVPDPGKIVVRYSYEKKSQGYQDDGYNEEIIFETDSGFSNLNAAGNLKDTKMIFGVHCFCRGKAGFYKVSEAEISYKDERLTVKIPDAIIEGQQVYQFDASVK